MALLFAVAALYPHPCSATSQSWTGTNSTDWGDDDNWDPAGAPAADDNVVIDNDPANTFNLMITGSQDRFANDLQVGATATGWTSFLFIGSDSTLALGGTAIIGDAAGASGYATITDVGSWLGVVGDLTIGAAGSGTLEISNGASVESANGFLGVSSGSTGKVTVDGAGSSWNMSSSSLYVGDAGIGTMTISNGGLVTNQYGVVGSNPSSGTSLVQVTGAGSYWMNAQDLQVGWAGNGAVRIENGGSTYSANGILGQMADGTGEVTVDGLNSLWTVANQLTVGYEGKGTLTISNGGLVISTFGTLGLEADGVGIVTVKGGANWIDGASLIVGDAGKGTLTVADGGMVAPGSTLTIANQSTSVGSFNIGAAPGSPAAPAGILSASVIKFGAGKGTVNFNHTETAYEFLVPLNGSGTINQIAGTTHLTSDSTAFHGSTRVMGGRLAVDGSLENSAVTVSGGVLGGTGTVGALTVGKSGTYAPGNSIGTQTVNGPFRLNPGAVFEVEANAAGQADKVIVVGTVNLTGSVLRVLPENGNYKPKTNYLIVDNDGDDAVAGQFAAMTSSLAFLAPSVIYNGGDGNDVVLTLERIVTPNGPLSFCSVAATNNQCNVARALDQFPTDDPLFLAVLNQTEADARQAFDALSGEIHATVPALLADESRYVREAVLGRLMQANYTSNAGQLAALGANGPQVASLNSQAMALGYDEEKSLAVPASGPSLAFWTRGYGAWGDFDGNLNAAAAERDLGGFVSGMDAQVSDTWRVGLAAGGAWSNVSLGAQHSSAEVESVHLAAYAGGMAGPLALRAGGAYAWQDIDTSRAVIFPGFFERQEASYDADTGQLFGEVAYPVTSGGIAFEPFVGLAYVNVDTERFREHGGALSALNGASGDQDVGYSTLGLRAATTMHWDSTLIVPKVSAAWQHAFDDVTPDAALAFASTGIGFGITGVPLAQDSLLLEAGLDFALSPTTTLGVSYSGQIADEVTDNAVKGRLNWLF